MLRTLSSAWRRTDFCVRCSLLLAAVTLGSDSAARADAPKATLQKVKQATVYLQVKTSGGAVHEGTGFFADQPGLIVTNAHVLGMLEPNSRKPMQVDVVVNSGEPNSKSYRGQVLGIDRGSDLGVLRIQGQGLPQPLKLGTAKDLTETQEVFIFGFPFGKRLGKNITVSKSSISSLRKSRAGAISRVQVNGGMNPGNSGGPVTDTTGQVIGVAVAIIKNTGINFAIPSDHVRNFLDGRLDLLTRDCAYRDGDKIKMPVRVHFLDPLAHIRDVAIEVWTAPAGKSRPSTGATEPKAVAGDSEKQVFPLTYDKKKYTAEGELILPALSDPKQVYWLRPVYTSGSGLRRWIGASGRGLDVLVERKPVQLKYQPAAKLMFVDMSSRGALRLRDSDGEEHTIKSNFIVGLRESPVGEASENGGRRFRMKFRRIIASIHFDDKPFTGRAGTKQIFDDLVHNLFLNLDMDGDGNQTRGESDLARVSPDLRGFISDVGDQVLQSLSVMVVPMPGDTVKPLQTWKTQRLLQVGPMMLMLPAQADLRYTYLGIREYNGQKQAVINVAGTLRGQRGNAGNIGGTMNGTLVVSPETGQVVNANATLKLDADVVYQKQSSKLNGELVVNMRRGEKPLVPPKKK